ncbi:Uncharacterized protein TCM_045478 [Theobroma cacao]|uniref:Uncharacterized protein n=1 Tax=Theobroma cacao TaxID=3641 RepID=A0A061FRY2_THECC|nr:Uncharacterized protein TCM_045478 [Theobroma cacao]
MIQSSILFFVFFRKTKCYNIIPFHHAKRITELMLTHLFYIDSFTKFMFPITTYKCLVLLNYRVKEFKDKN